MKNNSNPNPTDTTTTTPTNAPAGDQKSFANVLQEASSKIKDTQEFEDCMRPSVNMCLNQVGNELARKNKSVEFCNEMSEPTMQDACKFGVVMSSVTEWGDIKVCDTLSPTYKESCRSTMIMQSASASGDITKCDALSTSEDQNLNKKDQCYMMVISRDPKATAQSCEKITVQQEKTMCEMFMKNRSKDNLPN
jgi:hypothetical protein